MTVATILLLCPHNAAKSVYAAALLTSQADWRGLDLRVATAGTHPDAAVMPRVRERLLDLGLAADHTPVMVTAEALSAADHVVNIGCDPRDLPGDRTVESWSIPDISVDADVAFAAIEAAVRGLIDRLVGASGADQLHDTSDDR